MLEAGHASQFSTFGSGWATFKGTLRIWERVSSTLTDRLLAIVLAAFWIGLMTTLLKDM
jgi:hypothetical protein